MVPRIVNLAPTLLIESIVEKQDEQLLSINSDEVDLLNYKRPRLGPCESIERAHIVFRNCYVYDWLDKIAEKDSNNV